MRSSYVETTKLRVHATYPETFGALDELEERGICQIVRPPYPTSRIHIRESFSSIDGLVDYIKRNGFNVTVSGQYVVCEHESTSKTIFIKVIKMDVLQPSDWVRGVHLTAVRFRNLLKCLVAFWRERRHMYVGGLNGKVLTPFGWHAYSDEGTRQTALERSVVGLGTDRVLDVLEWLKGGWSAQPRTGSYRPMVETDYRWFLENFAASDFPGKLRREELLSELKSESTQLASESSAVKEFLENRDPDIFLIVAM